MNRYVLLSYHVGKKKKKDINFLLLSKMLLAKKAYILKGQDRRLGLEAALNFCYIDNIKVPFPLFLLEVQ